MNLSKNFTLSEFLSSQYATRKGIEEQFKPSETVIHNLQELVTHIIQPLRDALGMPIVISSGYRCEKVNTGIGGKGTSQHLTGQAADLEFPTISNQYLFEKIVELNLPFDQLLREFPKDGEPAWIHVSYSPKNRKQILTIN